MNINIRFTRVQVIRRELRVIAVYLSPVQWAPHSAIARFHPCSGLNAFIIGGESVMLRSMDSSVIALNRKY